MIDIAMCTFNGARYIEEQIKSIQSQGFQNWRLIISDDGSTDETIEIIKNISKNDTRLYLANVSKQGGVIPNFNRALLEATAPYIVLCDQDDIWPEDRLEKMLQALQEKEINDQPAMVFTDLELINSRGELIAPSFYYANNLSPFDNLKDNSLLWRSTVYGCSTIFNRKLLDIALPIPNYAFMHDQWLALNAQVNNGLYYSDMVSIKYRQHDSNVVGGGANNFGAKILSFKKTINTLLKHQKKSKELIQKHYRANHNNKDEKNRCQLINFANKEILPNVFNSSKKMFSLIMYIMFVCKK